MSFDIHQKRKELGLTLEEIAKFVGVTKSTVKKWESGHIKNMRRDKIIKLAAVLEVSPSALLPSDNDLGFKAPQVTVLNDELSQALNLILSSAFDISLGDNFVLALKGRKLILFDELKE